MIGRLWNALSRNFHEIDRWLKTMTCTHEWSRVWWTLGGQGMPSNRHFMNQCLVSWCSMPLEAGSKLCEMNQHQLLCFTTRKHWDLQALGLWWMRENKQSTDHPNYDAMEWGNKAAVVWFARHTFFSTLFNISSALNWYTSRWAFWVESVPSLVVGNFCFLSSPRKRQLCFERLGLNFSLNVKKSSSQPVKTFIVQPQLKMHAILHYSSFYCPIASGLVGSDEPVHWLRWLNCFFAFSIEATPNNTKQCWQSESASAAVSCGACHW